jgi:hypothetical protein
MVGSEVIFETRFVLETIKIVPTKKNNIENLANRLPVDLNENILKKANIKPIKPTNENESINPKRIIQAILLSKRVSRLTLPCNINKAIETPGRSKME